MTAVLGVDGSARHTGLGLPDGRCCTVTPPARLAEDIVARLHWMTSMVMRLVACHPPDVVIMEDYEPHSPGYLATIRQAEASGCLRMLIFERGVPLVLVGAGQLKRWATGNGNADKPRMVAAARSAGFVCGDDHQADAAALHAMGRHVYDGQVLFDAERTVQEEVIAQVAWPALRRAVRTGGAA